jgi:hypothetical protein
MLGFQDTSFEEFSELNLKLLFSFSNDCFLLNSFVRDHSNVNITVYQAAVAEYNGNHGI